MKLFSHKYYNFKTEEIEYRYEPNEDDSGYLLEDGISVLRVTEPEYVDSFEFYTHEFTEITLLKCLRPLTRKWMWFVRFKSFKASRLAHLLSPYGYPNKLTLFPDPSIRKVYKSLLNTLSKEELEIRIKMGDCWNET
jgi:hypothetical protein